MTSGPLCLPERRPVRTFLAVGLLFVLAYSAAAVVAPKSRSRIIVGDAVHYYTYLRSAVFDFDLQFRNDYVRIYGLKGGEEGTEWVYEPTATGHARNMMAVGPSLVWAPLFLLVTGGVALARAFGSTYPLDGYGLLFQASAGISGILAATAGACMTWALCRRFFDARTAFWSTIAVWLGSNAVYYSLISPAYSHSSSMLVLSAFCYAWGTSIDRQTPRRYAAVGALAGLAALVRWQDAVFLIVPLADAVTDMVAPARQSNGVVAPTPPGARSGDTTTLQSTRPRWRAAVINLLACGIAALAAFLPQIWAWMVLYGRPIAIPQGSQFMQWTRPSLAATLFSDNHGLFTWTPILAACVIGIVPLWQRQRRLAIGLTAALAASWYANAAVIDWWAGEAYGARRFVSCFPIFVLGFAALIDPLKDRLGRLVSAVSVFVILNFLLLLQYQVFMHGWMKDVPYPRGFYGLVVARFVVPLQLIARIWTP
jgi:hypothetical protein